jgi:hypothetical protein
MYIYFLDSQFCSIDLYVSIDLQYIFQDCFYYSSSLEIPYEFYHSFSGSAKKKGSWVYLASPWISFRSIITFTILNRPIHEHRPSIYFSVL